MPTSITSTPTDRNPAVAAWVNIAPDVRASRPSTTHFPPRERTQAPSAAAWRATSSGVRSVPTWPRSPDTEIISVSDIRQIDIQLGREIGSHTGERLLEGRHDVGVEL